MDFCVGDIKHIKTTENKLDLECMLRTSTMGAILCLVPVPTAQILHPDSDIKSLSTFRGSLWGKKHGDLRFFFQVFPKNSLINNMFEEEKSLIVEHDFLLENSSVLGVFWPKRGLQAFNTTELSENLQYPQNQAIKNGLNEATLFM